MQRICSDQVIVDLQSALKELLENALDAGATKIEVRLKEHGTDLLEVADNGSGIAPENLDGVALRHHTSKLSEFDDLQKLRSFGFRGEALNSLAALATLTLSTRTAASPVGTALTFGSDGAVASRATAAREVGTCVSVGELFKSFPVRRRELQRNAAAEFRKVLLAVQAYAIICDGVRFVVTHTLGKGGRQVVLQTEGARGGGGTSGGGGGTSGGGGGGGGGSDGGGIARRCRHLRRGRWRSCCRARATAHPQRFIRAAAVGAGRRAGDRQYVFVNRRPVDFPKLSAVNAP